LGRGHCTRDAVRRTHEQMNSTRVTTWKRGRRRESPPWRRWARPIALQRGGGFIRRRYGSTERDVERAGLDLIYRKRQLAIRRGTDLYAGALSRFHRTIYARRVPAPTRRRLRTRPGPSPGDDSPGSPVIAAHVAGDPADRDELVTTQVSLPINHVGKPGKLPSL
jgi:hypothetical protein